METLENRSEIDKHVDSVLSSIGYSEKNRIDIINAIGEQDTSTSVLDEKIDKALTEKANFIITVKRGGEEYRKDYMDNVQTEKLKMNSEVMDKYRQSVLKKLYYIAAAYDGSDDDRQTLKEYDLIANDLGEITKDFHEKLDELEGSNR